jgi:hypothetical protein
MGWDGMGWDGMGRCDGVVCCGMLIIVDGCIDGVTVKV